MTIAVGSFVSRLFTSGLSTGFGIGLASTVVQGIKNVVPQIEDEVTVEVHGHPGATKKQLYYLALATGFGLIRRFDLRIGSFFPTPPAGLLMVEYDAADNWVRATIKYTTSLIWTAVGKRTGTVVQGALTGAAFGAVLGPGAIAGAVIGGVVAFGIDALASLFGPDAKEHHEFPNEFYEQAVVYAGPPDHVVGGAFNFTGEIGPGVPSTSESVGAPKLPFTGKGILTTIPTDKGGNPTPPGDHISRGALAWSKSKKDTGLGEDNLTKALIPLVFAALSNPGSYSHEFFV